MNPIRVLDRLIEAIPRPAWGGLAFLCASAIIAMGQRPAGKLPRLNQLPHQDKILHFLAYAGLASLIARWVIPLRARDRVEWGLWAWLMIATLPSLLGMTDELLQGWANRGRSSDIRDWMADTLGALAVVALVAWGRRKASQRGATWQAA